MVSKTKISDSGRGTYFIYDKALKSGWVVGYIKNDAGLSTDPKLYKTYGTSRGIYINIPGIGRVYLRDGY